MLGTFGRDTNGFGEKKERKRNVEGDEIQIR